MVATDPAPAAHDATLGPDETAASAAADPTPAAYDASLVSNGSFESTDNAGIPNGWTVSPPTIIDRKATGEAAEGKSWLALKGVKETPCIIEANVSLSPDFFGRDLRISAYGKAPDASKLMSLALMCEVGGKETCIATKPWPKTGNRWEKVEYTAAVPSSADPKSVRVRVSFPKGAGSGYALDGVRAVIDLLGLHAGLDEVDKTGRPVGWIAIPPDVIASDSELPSVSGGHVVALRAPREAWGLFARNMKLGSADLGKTIVVAASAYAEAGDNLRFSVNGKVGGKTVTLASEYFPATIGASKQIALKVELPKELDPASVYIRFEIRQGVEGLYGISQVQAGQ